MKCNNQDNIYYKKEKKKKLTIKIYANMYNQIT